MARYTGPKHKLARREGINVLDKTSKTLQRRLNVLPGAHSKRKTKRLSEFGQQLREKQKAKAIYGVLEKQFRLTVNKSQRLAKVKKQDAGELLIAFLETRLDNLVYRLGYAKTRFQARQFVSHGHVLVNGKKLTIASYSVREKEVISLTDKIKTNPNVIELAGEEPNLLPFLEFEKNRVSGRLLRMPKREDIEVPFDTQLIIEYYSR
ncbi:MAG: 30S ribosomal protein S4 [bacterium]|nr:30S ribosomal protein S4 [bacterium]